MQKRTDAGPGLRYGCLSMSGRVVFFVQSATFEPAYQVATMGITAAAMGDQVYFVLAFDALRQLVRKSFGLPRTEREAAESARAEGLGLPTPAKLLAEARSLGAKVVACETTVRICGLVPEELAGVLDEVMGLPSIWKLTEGARTLTF
ncbi:MAG: DsrE family protein [Myxococcaceae bacterium]|nr:DsrE family protein [Myxococcaceae bacterium]